MTEFFGGLFNTPVIIKSCFAPEKFSIDNVCPTTSVLSKYLFAFSAVITKEKGPSNAVSGSPCNNVNPYIVNIVLSQICNSSLKLLSPFDTFDETPSQR